MTGAFRRTFRPLLALATLVAGGLGLGSSPAAGVEFSVTNNSDAGPGSLRQAFIDADNTPGDDVIVVQPGVGTVTLTTGPLTHVPSPAADLALQGNGVTINANGSGGIAANNTPNLSLDRVTITGGTGGAVGVGGGAVWTAGNLVVTNSTITDNDTAGTGGDGGGVLAENNLSITNSTISGNTATDEAGGASAGANATVTNSTFTGNIAGSNGGGMNVSGNVSVTASTISGNTVGPSVHRGGGIAAGGNVTLTRSTLSGNTVDGGSGGGIGSSSAVTATNSTISGNTAAVGAGGIGASEDVTLVYATVVGNSSTDGANIGSEAGLVSFGSVVALSQGGGAACTILGSATSNGFNFSDDASCGFTGIGDRQNAGAPGLGALGNNGGPTQTRLPEPGSPLIDAIGVANCNFDGITTDQRGVSRPQGPGCDIGAVEVQVTAPVSAAEPIVAPPRFTG
jgi:hypothetical protein